VQKPCLFGELQFAPEALGFPVALVTALGLTWWINI